MNIVFLSNFYNHHQSGISRALYEQTGGQYRFVATEPMPEERRQLGYADLADTFVMQYGADPAQDADIQQWIDTADAVIVGSAPEHLLAHRKQQKKLILRYAERPLKKGFQWWKYPMRWYRWHKLNPRSAPIYMLCASAYTAPDYAKFGLFRNKALKWGYFPQCRQYESIAQLLARKVPTEILWCGRFLDWKHPDDALTAAARLKQENYDFHLTIIGTGEMAEQLKAMTDSLGLTDCVTFTGAMSTEQVRTAMEEAGIYLMTSDRKEGWGAVVNEAMNSGCAIVASRAAGAVPYLVQDGVNGMIYDAGCADALYEKIRFLLAHPAAQQRMGAAAYETIVTTWNAETAARRLVQVIAQLQQGQAADALFSDGPCSRA